MEQTTDTYYRAYTTRDARFDGRVFAGVRTTGIYCRPVCPARMPKRENMTFFPTAAAAQEAGFRPCLRCRPESAPDFAGWRGASPVVHRALSLIEDGWLEDRDIDALAAQLEVSGRQLRRLFREHLGATPVAVAQTRRVLLAKQLIHETDLSMADVAMASGFGSVRRFNETFQRLFDRPPAALRRQRSPGLATGSAITLRLPYRPPYDWVAMLESLAQRAIPGVEQVAGHTYSRTVRSGSHVGWIRVRPGSGDRLRLEVHHPDLGALPKIIGRVRRLLDLSADSVAIDAQLADDALLAPLVAARPGLRVPGVWEGFEEAIRIALESDRSGLDRLVRERGRPLNDSVAADAGLTHAFPQPEDFLASDSEDRLAMLAVPTAISSLAVALVAEPTLLDQHRDPQLTASRLRGLTALDSELAAKITSGVLEGYDSFPTSVVPTIVNAKHSLLGMDELARRSQSWSPWRRYAAAHLLAAMADPGCYDKFQEGVTV